MPASHLNPDRPRDTILVTAVEKVIKCGRKRYCKKCTFTCTDAREFTAHHSMHTDSDDKEDDISYFPQNSRIAKLGFRRPLRQKCNSKGSVLDRAAVMKPEVDNIAEAVSAVEDCVYQVTFPSDNTTLNNSPEQSEVTDIKSLRSDSFNEYMSCEHTSNENFSSERNHLSSELKSSERNHLSSELKSSERNHLSSELKSSERNHLSSEMKSSKRNHLSSELKSSERNHLSSELKSGERNHLSSELKSGERNHLSSELKSSEHNHLSSELKSSSERNHLSSDLKSSERDHLSSDLKSSERNHLSSERNHLSSDVKSSERDHLSSDLKSSERDHLSSDIKSSMNASSGTDEHMDVKEKRDELNAMASATSRSNININNSSDNKALPSDIDNFFRNDNDDRLGIDNGNIGKIPARLGSIQNQIYSCHHCDMTTTSAKSYAHHLSSDHSIEFNLFECDLCDDATVYKQKLPLHQKLHFLPEEVNPPPKSLFQPVDESPTNIGKNKSLLSKPFCNSSKQDLFIKDDTDEFEDEDNYNTPTRDQTSAPTTPLTIAAENVDKIVNEGKKRKNKIRQEVDPGKYFEAVDGQSTKYGCSQCGNIYKWRKSLNKHWKEKHTADDLLEVASPPGMVEVLKLGKYTQIGAQRIYDKIFLATIKIAKNDDSSFAATPISLTRSPSPANFQNITNLSHATTSSLTPTGLPMIPTMIGPFVSNAAQPVFPGMPMFPHFSLHGNGSREEDALSLSNESKLALRVSPYPIKWAPNQHHDILLDQDEPLDFSKSSKSTGNATHELTDFNSQEPTHSINQIQPKQHHCSKCYFSCTCEDEFANHTNSHFNKRIFRCFECKLQINSMDELNNHFIKLHFQKLSEHKEAIKKIPHGFQQSYHVLNMNMQDIGELGNQDLGAAEGRSLKCKKCNFEAKWPAELQKHAVSHSEDRPFICMVCGSTYKWKWDLVKHFHKSHKKLPNPYKKNDKDTPDGSSEDEEKLPKKRRKVKRAGNDMNQSQYNRDDVISTEGIISAAEDGQTLISHQPNILADDSTIGRNLSVCRVLLIASSANPSATEAFHEVDRYRSATKTFQGTATTRSNSVSGRTVSGNGKTETSSCPNPGGTNSDKTSYKCELCNFIGRWPSEVTQHRKNHSSSKPYLCPRCEYRSRWKWDVVKHLKCHCGGGTINDVIDTTKLNGNDVCGSPNAGKRKPVDRRCSKIKNGTLEQPQSNAFIDENVQSTTDMSHTSSSSGNELSRPVSRSLTQDINNSIINRNNNDCNATDSNVNDNYAAYTSNFQFANVNQPNLTASNMFSTIGNMISANSPASSSMPSSVKKTRSSRQSSSGQVWNCPHCPFTTQSQAELKRHSDLHSDDKPFKCDVCQYSTRWACDLKKHRKGYNHYPKINCKDVAEKNEKIPPRFKCSHCEIYFETFVNLLQHRLAEHVSQGSSQSSTAAPAENEVDMARIKHPRKQIKQFKCHKCPFICKSKQTMAEHINDHEQLEHIGINCFYCNSPFKDKESLLDHITTHSAFNPNEWETFFMIIEEEQSLPKADKTISYRKDGEHSQRHGIKKTKFSNDNSHHQEDYNKHATDSTEARIKQILDEIPKQMTAPQKVPYLTQFKCEWCPDEFVNLTALYKHASQSHPIQLKKQDVNMDVTDEDDPPKVRSDQPIPVKKSFTGGEAIDILKLQVEKKRNHQMIEKHVDGSIPRFEENHNKKLRDEKDSRHYNCDKCSFSSSDFTTFQNHYEFHESRKQSQCWFCDFTVDKINLLFQHMSTSHTRKWNALSQNRKFASYIRRINRAFASNGISGNSIDNPAGNSQNAVNLSFESKTPPPDTINSIIYVTRQQYTWSEIPVNVVLVGNILNFLCPHCSFHNASVSNTCNHVVQNHQAMSKFTCKKCQFSDDSIQSMSDHCKKEHIPTERIVEVVDFKQIDLTDLQNLHLNALTEQIVVKKDSGLNLKLTKRTMCCPFCPFKTLFTDHMKVHVSYHSRQEMHQCPLCDYRSDTSSAIKSHVKVHEPDYTMDSRSLSVTKPEVNLKNESIDTQMDELELGMIARAQPIMGQKDGNHNNLEEIQGSKMGRRIRYRCLSCPYHTTCRSNMVKHTRQHNNSKKYKCSKCSYGAARAVLLKHHIDSHETPVENNGQHLDIFYDPNNPNSNLENDNNESGEIENEDANSDDDEIDAREITDLEAKDILEAESALQDSILLKDGNSSDKPLYKQKCPQCLFSRSGSELKMKFGTQERDKCDHCSYSLDRLNLRSQNCILHEGEPGYISNPPMTDLLNTSLILQQNTEVAETGDTAVSYVPKESSNASSINQFSCKLCPYQASKKRVFKIHYAYHGSRKLYICDFCDWSANQIGLLHQHRRVHEDELLYNPKPEDKIFLNQEFDYGAEGEFEAKVKDIKNAGKPVNGGERGGHMLPPFKLTVIKKSHPCRQCPFKSNSRHSYYVHKRMHNSRSDFACNKCSYSSVNKGLLQQHLHLHNSDADASSPLRGISDRHEVHHLKPAIEHHKNVTSLNKINKPQDISQFGSYVYSELKCERCPFKATSQTTLIDHIRGHVSQESLKCPYCDFSATSIEDIYTHAQIHFPGPNVGVEALECLMEDVKKSCNSIHNLNSNHNRFKSFSPKPDKLPAEEETATKIQRVYVCQFCEREFEAKQLMIQHEKQHLVGSQ